MTRQSPISIGPTRVVSFVDEVTASANEVTNKAGFIGRENVACLYRELTGIEQVWFGRGGLERSRA